MEITELFIYPIKSLGGTSVDRAVVTKNGFLFDRCYVVLKPNADRTELKHMSIGQYPEMALFTTSIRFPDAEQLGDVTVTYNPPVGEGKSIVLPLQPDLNGLEPVDVNMHGSETGAYDMGARYNHWFSDCFGYPVILAAIGANERRVLFPKSPNAQSTKSTSWLSGIAKSLTFASTSADEDEQIKFQDCAPFLVVTQKSCDNVSDRLPAGEKMDIRKFRPNIIVSGEEAWDEDFWGSIKISGGESAITVPLQQNCVRCQSLNVDFKTGKYDHQVLKLMQKDRRVDVLQKYSPVFGRYGYSTPDSIGEEMRIGAKVEVTKRNEQRTPFDWPGL